jgi:hypothetical protein
MAPISLVETQNVAQSGNPGILDKLTKLKPLQPPAAAKKLAQATGSELLLPAQVKERNPGQVTAYWQKSAGRIFSTTRDLQNAELLSQGAADSKVVKSISLGEGASIPSGSTASGAGTGRITDSLYRGGTELTFALPNGSKLSFYASNESLGKTDIEVTDKAGNKTTSTVNASLVFDNKSQSLRFISAAGEGKFRVADLRSQLGASNQKLVAALKNIGVAGQR